MTTGVRRDRFDCDGVHLGPGDAGFERVAPVREALPQRLIGLSCATIEEVRAANASGVDYIGVGSVYATPSKSDAGAPIGTAGLGALANASAVPAAAVGGITASTLPRNTAGRRCYGRGDIRNLRRAGAATRGARADRGVEPFRSGRRIVTSIVLSIGTTHPWNVAGVGRDLVVGADFGARVFTAVAAVSAQDTRGVTALHAIPIDAFVAQLAALPWDSAGAVRIGALPTLAAVHAVSEPLRSRPWLPAVIDPVFSASRSGELAEFVRA